MSLKRDKLAKSFADNFVKVDLDEVFGEEEGLHIPADSALDVQVSGNHYKQFKIQPIEFFYANNIPFAEANIIKYVTRHKFKNGKEDLLKAKHMIDLLIQLEYGE